MKKILFFLLTAITLTACGSDDPDPIKETPFDNWNDPANPHYTNGKYNPMVGEWQLLQRNGVDATDFLVYKFDSKFTQSEATVEPTEEKEPVYSNSKSYITNDKEYKIATTVYSYAIAGTLENARLTIKEGNTTLTFKPYVSKVWSWKGDWNSPSNPHYEIYKGKYNPIVGTWKLTHVGGEPNVGNPTYYHFKDDFTLEQSYSSTPGSIVGIKRKYWINDIGVKEDSFTIESYFPSYTYSYKIEGNTLYYKTMLPKPSSTMTFIKI